MIEDYTLEGLGSVYQNAYIMSMAEKRLNIHMQFIERLSLAIKGRFGEKQWNSDSPKELAAVSLVLSRNSNDINLLFMRRPLKKDDTFSGQVCFPGGKKEPEDHTLLETAIRETKEEVGIDLNKEKAFYIGKLSNQIPIHPDSKEIAVTPYVFYKEQHGFTRVHTLEVESLCWIPLSNFLKSNFHIKTVIAILNGLEVDAYKIPLSNDCYIIWGLTYRILQEFLSVWLSINKK